MTKKLLLGSSVLAGIVLLLYAQAPSPPRLASKSGDAAKVTAAKAAPAAPTVDPAAIIDEYCVDCHNQTKRAGGFSFDTLDPAHFSEHAETWEKIVRKLRAGMMPPSGNPRPAPAEYEAFIRGLENELDRHSAARLPAPGLHRLNRTEYTNVIRDVLGVEVDASKFLPSDDSTHGFDNQAGTLTVSPALIEAYRSAAGKITRMAIGDVSTPAQAVYRVAEGTSQDYHIEGLPFGTRGGIVVNHEFPVDGDYVIRVWPVNKGNMDNNNAFGEIKGEKLEVLLDSDQLKVFDWDREIGRGNAVHQGSQELKFSAKAGQHTVGATFLATNYAPGNDLDKHFLRSTIETGGLPGFSFYPHVGYIRIDGPYNSQGAADSPSRRKIFICAPAAQSEETGCAQKILTALVRRAYRRPATAASVELLMNFYQKGRNDGDFDHGIELAVQRMLMDPDFIFRKETEPDNVPAGQKFRMPDLDLASRLSFFLWSTIPDDELLNLAAQNKLHDPKTLEAQVKRMLADTRSEQFVNNFAGQWLNVRGVATQAPVTQAFPDFDDNLRQAFQREAELFVGSVLHEDRSVTDFLDADYTFVNERLAKHYGIPNVYGSNFRRVTLSKDLDVRRGLLGKGFLLEVSSQPGRTSPVQRGKTVMQVFLGVSPPNPPPNVVIKISSTESDVHGAAKPTMRQQMESHRTNEPCHSCHAIMDPIGFSLENFDAVGAWRTEDAGSPIDASGMMFDGSKLNGVQDLRETLLKYSPQFVRVVTERLMTYALGRGVEYYDMPLVRSLVRESERDNYKFSSLIMAVVKSEPFQFNTKGLTYGSEIVGQ
ncbi:MAG TPA: DUF1592 domain-containing protein [Bryobacteraceae bacterium]|jgi:mono/diheme cytochrome c family protein